MIKIRFIPFYSFHDKSRRGVPFCFVVVWLGALQNSAHERDSLPQGKERDHSGNHNGEQADNFIEYAADQISGHNGLQCSSFHLGSFLLEEHPKKFVAE